MHGSRGDSAQVERALEGGVKEKTAVLEVSGRKQDSDERLVEVIGRGESVGTKGSGGRSESHDWKDIRDILGGYEDAEDVEKEREEEDIFYSVFALEDMPLMQRQDPELAEIITYLSTGDLPKSDKAARKILMIEDQFTLDDGVLWHFFCS